MGSIKILDQFALVVNRQPLKGGGKIARLSFYIGFLKFSGFKILEFRKPFGRRYRRRQDAINQAQQIASENAFELI
jgi:hypothetical protein